VIGGIAGGGGTRWERETEKGVGGERDGRNARDAEKLERVADAIEKGARKKG